jgi:hypothetical protein
VNEPTDTRESAQEVTEGGNMPVELDLTPHPGAPDEIIWTVAKDLICHLAATDLGVSGFGRLSANGHDSEVLPSANATAR